MNEILSASAFDIFLTLAVGLVAAVWVVYDVRNLVKLRGADRADPIVRDKRFGYVMGLFIGGVGVIGAVGHQLGIHFGLG